MDVMREMIPLPKLKRGDTVAVLSPSFAAPGRWPQVYELGLERLRNIFGLNPVEFPRYQGFPLVTTILANELRAKCMQSHIRAAYKEQGPNYIE